MVGCLMVCSSCTHKLFSQSQTGSELWNIKWNVPWSCYPYFSTHLTSKYLALKFLRWLHPLAANETALLAILSDLCLTKSVIKAIVSKCHCVTLHPCKLLLLHLAMIAIKKQFASCFIWLVNRWMLSVFDVTLKKGKDVSCVERCHPISPPCSFGLN